MNRSKNYLVLGLISILVFACQTETLPQTPSVALPEPVSTTLVVLPAPALTVTSFPPMSTLSKITSPTPTNTISRSKTPDQIEDGAIDKGVCVPEDTAPSITDEIFKQPDFENTIAKFLNDGGSPKALGYQLNPEEAVTEPNLIQVIRPDIDSDGIADVLVTITLHHFDGYGETHVLAYVCRDGQYENRVLFRRAGAGSRAEGLYAGGGAKIESLDDLNQDGTIEILFSVNWPGYAEYYLVTWANEQFTSLIEYIDILGNLRYSLDVEPGNVKVDDVDSDGIYELVVTAMNYQTMLEETNNWFWDGKKYSLPNE